MAKISAMPSKDIVDSFRGTLDFYRWCDLVIVRKWPRSPGRLRNPNVMAAAGQFIYINKLASTLDPEIIQLYKNMATGSGLSWKDYLVRLYSRGAAWWTG